MTTELTKAEPQAIQSASPTPGDLLRIAVEKGVDVEKLDKLMEMQMKWEANESKKAYVQAMAKFRSRCPQIIKTEQVSFKQTHYNHASLGGTIEQIKELMTECGLSHSWRLLNDDPNRPIGVKCVITHEQGHSEETTLHGPPDNSGAKNAIQAVSSTVTYLQRYTLFAMLGLAAAPDDDGRTAGQPAQPLSRGFSKPPQPQNQPAAPEQAPAPIQQPVSNQTPQNGAQGLTEQAKQERKDFAQVVDVLAMDAGVLQQGQRLAPGDYKAILMQAQMMAGCDDIPGATQYVMTRATGIVKDAVGIRLCD